MHEEKMEFRINPTVAYLLIVTIVIVLSLTILDNKFTVSRYGIILCLVVVLYELFYLELNPWALLVVALSPLLFHFAIRQTSVHLSSLVLAILMLALGSFYLFLDENGHPVINYRLAGLIFTLYSIFIWITIGHMRNAEGIRLNHNPDSVIGLIGETRTDIEAHSAGSVLVGGEVWQAQSKRAIPAGSTVRVLRLDGFWLTVKELETLTKNKN
jgi:membrane-bound serine protease (ClpP class)